MFSGTNVTSAVQLQSSLQHTRKLASRVRACRYLPIFRVAERQHLCQHSKQATFYIKVTIIGGYKI